MSNNFRKTAVLKKCDLSTKATKERIVRRKFWGVLLEFLQRLALDFSYICL